MASIKARKGNPFEREVAYNLQLMGYEVTRLNDNSPGADLLAEDEQGDTYLVECKCHNAFTWNELIKVFGKTERYAKGTGHFPAVMFKAKRQPVLLMARDTDTDIITVVDFSSANEREWKKVPKGWKVWQ